MNATDEDFHGSFANDPYPGFAHFPVGAVRELPYNGNRSHRTDRFERSRSFSS